MNASVDWMSRGRQPRKIQVPSASRGPHTALTTAATVPAEWQDQVVDRLFDLLQLPENWDSYGASAPSRASAIELLDVLASIMQSNTPAPSIVPSSQGHFQAEWHRDGVDLEVEVVTPTKICVTYTDALEEWEEEFDFDFTRIVHAVKKLKPAA